MCEVRVLVFRGQAKALKHGVSDDVKTTCL